MQLPLSGKTLLTKVSIKTLTLSMSFNCFLCGFSGLYESQPAVSCFLQLALWAEQKGSAWPCVPDAALLRLCTGLPNPTAALKPTQAVLAFPGWSDFIA